MDGRRRARRVARAARTAAACCRRCTSGGGWPSTGPSEFGEVYYLGTVPLAGHDGLVDVLVGTPRAASSAASCSTRPTGHLLAVEMFPEEDVDPCEVYFADYREVDGRWLPGRMEVRVGDDVYGVFKLDEFTFEKPRSR